MAIQPSNFSGENKSMPPIVTAAVTAAQSLGKSPRGWGIRASCSRGHCICQEGKDRAYRKIDTVEPVHPSFLLKSNFWSGILKFIIRSNKLHGCGCLNPFNTNLFNLYNFKRREHHQLLHKSLNLPTEEVNRWTVVIQHKQIRPTGWGGVHFSTGTLCSWNLLIEKLVMRRFVLQFLLLLRQNWYPDSHHSTAPIIKGRREVPKGKNDAVWQYRFSPKHFSVTGVTEEC